MAEQPGPNQAAAAPGEDVMRRHCPVCGARAFQRCIGAYGLPITRPHKGRSV